MEMDTSKLSELGRGVWSSRDKIIHTWIDKVRSNIKAASKLSDPIIVDTLPAFLDTLAQALSPAYELAGYEILENISDEHGNERARLSFYSPSDVIHELQTLRWTIFEALEDSHFPLQQEDIDTINKFMDASVRNAVTAFELVHADLRERFIATLTHDLKNPLSAIDMAAELIGEEETSSKEANELVYRIKNNVRRMDRMIQDILDASVIKAGEKLKLNITYCDFFAIINNVVKDASLVHGKRFSVHGMPTPGYWDPLALSRAIENLISNALKYGKANSVITLRLKESFGRAIFTIHNEGKTIPIEEQEAIFQIYRRAQAAKDGNQQGWGIGLPLVRSVAESHGGSATVTSTNDFGTEFLIDIPLDARAV